MSYFSVNIGEFFFSLFRLQSLGALNVGYKSNVLSLAVTDIEFEKNMIICGSEDKSIKVLKCTSMHALRVNEIH